MNNKKEESLSTGFKIGMTIGLFVSVFFCISIGLFSVIHWIGLLGAVVGGIIGSCVEAKNAPSPAERAAKESAAQEQFVKEYKDVIQNLPQKQMDRLGNIMATIVRTFLAEGAEAKDIPIELSKMGSVAMTLMNEKQYGTLTPAQCNAVDKVLDEFEESIRYTLPAFHNAMNNAANQGLGFGIIGSAANVALHSTMDTMERIKNLNTTMRGAGSLIDQKVKALLVELRVAIATKTVEESYSQEEQITQEPVAASNIPAPIQFYLSSEGEQARKAVYERNISRSGNLQDDIYEYLNCTEVALVNPDMTDFFGETPQKIRPCITPLIAEGLVGRLEYEGKPYFYLTVIYD